jgi:predicted nucleic acid-binding protein
MMSNIIDINSYQPQKDDIFFFDTNIWMYLYCPLGDYKKHITQPYSNFFKKVLSKKSSIFIASVVLAEFFNACTRLEFNLLKNKEPEIYQDFKKDFRNSEHYKSTVITIKNVVKHHILKVAQRIDDKFNHINVDELFTDIELSDFNDNYIIFIANYEKMKVITHDSDFHKKNLKTAILTANKQLLPAE